MLAVVNHFKDFLDSKIFSELDSKIFSLMATKEELTTQIESLGATIKEMKTSKAPQDDVMAKVDELKVFELSQMSFKVDWVFAYQKHTN